LPPGATAALHGAYWVLRRAKGFEGFFKFHLRGSRPRVAENWRFARQALAGKLSSGA
jgi:hypothetical protein